MKENLKQIGKGFMLTIMTIQILFGMVYFFCTFFALFHDTQEFGIYFSNTTEYLATAATGIFDEYGNFLYPQILKAAIFVQNTVGIPYQLPVFLLQLILGFAGIYFLIGSLFPEQGKLKKTFETLFLLSSPLVAFWQVSLLPEALATSLCIFLVTLFIRKRRTVILYLIFLSGIILLGLLSKDVACILAIALLVLSSIKLISTKGKEVFYFWSLILVVLGICSSLFFTSLMETTGSGGKIQKTLASVWVQKIVYPYFSLNYNFFHEDVKTAMDSEQAYLLSKKADAIVNQGDDIFDVPLGLKGADELYKSMVATSFSLRTKENLILIGTEILAYSLPPIAVFLNFQGIGDSYSGWNYSRMLESSNLDGKTDVLIGLYMNYGLVIAMGFFLYGIIKILTVGRESFGNRKRTLEIKKEETIRTRAIEICLLAGIAWVVFFTFFQGSYFDYKNAILINLFWGFLWVNTWNKTY